MWCSRVVKLAFDRAVNNHGFAKVVNLLYTPCIQGGIYKLFDSPVNAKPPTPGKLAGAVIGCGFQAFRRDLLAVEGRFCRQGGDGGRGAVPGTHNELLPTKGLEYISTSWLVFV